MPVTSEQQTSETPLFQRLDHRLSKVAVLRASRIGDFICATPALSSIRAALPGAEISLITLPMLKDMVLRYPEVDRFIPFPGFPGIAEQLFDAQKTGKFFREMQAEAFDLAIQMQGSGVYSNPFTLMLGAKRTAGFIRPGDPPGRLDAALPLPNRGHEIERVLSLSRFLGAQPQGNQTRFPLWDEDYSTADALLRDTPPPWIGLHPSARDQTREWPIDRFAQAGKELHCRAGGTLVGLGESSDNQKIAGILEAAGAPSLNLAGKTSLPVLGAVLSRLSVFITNDTGPAHIAYALETPTVTIFGGGDPGRYGPHLPGPFRILAHPVPCRPCDYAKCPVGTICLHNIHCNQVVEAAFEIIR